MSSEGKTAGPDTEVIEGGQGYLASSIAELRKVTTPTRQEAMQATIVTLIIIAFMSVCLFLMDYIFHTVISRLIGTV